MIQNIKNVNVLCLLLDNFNPVRDFSSNILNTLSLWESLNLCSGLESVSDPFSPHPSPLNLARTGFSSHPGELGGSTDPLPPAAVQGVYYNEPIDRFQCSNYYARLRKILGIARGRKDTTGCIEMKINQGVWKIK